MPELPEVETIARGLEPLVLNKKISRVSLNYPKIISGDPQIFQKEILDRSIVKVWRRAKLLILDLAGSFHLVFHLKMSGKVWVPPQGECPDKHTHIVFCMNNGESIFFQDQRKFGYCVLLDSNSLNSWKFFAGLGPEPLHLSLNDFVEIFRARKGRIKSLLLDQRNIAGIGNIYADEALFMAGIHPRTPGCELKPKDYKILYQSLKEVLVRAIEAGGSSFRNYRNALGYSGMFQEKFLVYGKKGQSCPRCRTVIETCKVAGRTSCVCPTCQKVNQEAGHE